MNKLNVRKLTGFAFLIAIEILFQIGGNFITISGVSINLSLIPIVIASILYTPFEGAFLGLINGIIVLVSPATIGFFFQYAPLGTIVTCLIKCTIAGLLSGLLYKLISKKNETLGVIIASIAVPIINTLIFAICCFTILSPSIEAKRNGADTVKFVFLTLIGINFIVEFLLTLILSPTVSKIIKTIKKKETK